MSKTSDISEMTVMTKIIEMTENAEMTDVIYTMNMTKRTKIHIRWL